MTDRPIIFSAPMVQALLAGRKTQTRRVAKITWAEGANREFTGWHPERKGPNRWHLVGGMGIGATISVPYAPGDRLYVREAWRTWAEDDHLSPRQMMAIFDDHACSAPGDLPDVRFEAGGFLGDERPHFKPGRLRQGMHLPRRLSRLTLTVTEVRVQRLQDISAGDTIAEGVECSTCVAMGQSACHGRGCFASRAAYIGLWDSLHGPDAWDANPWVVAVSFTVQRGNIDAGG